MNLYALNQMPESGHEQTIGVFTSPELAIEYVYWMGVNELYHGYVAEQRKVIWRNYYDFNWKGYITEKGLNKPSKRDLWHFSIYRLTVDNLMVDLKELKQFISDHNLPTQQDIVTILDYFE